MHSRKKSNRRAVLKALVGGAAIVIPAWNEEGEAADSLVCVQQTPTVTEGPYWVDEKLFRSDIRTDPSTGVARAGIPLALTITLESLGSATCSAVSGAYVDIWHCDAKGIYSDEGTYNPGGGTGAVNTAGQKFLRGYQITDAAGQVRFTTVYPGWYGGRTIHVHVRVRTYSGSTVLTNFVTQIFFDETINNAVLATSAYARTTARDTLNSTDMVYRTANPERMLATVTGDINSGYQAALTIGSAFQTPGPASPAIRSGGVVNAASGVAGVAPRAWISIFGSGLSATTRSAAAPDLAGNALPTSLDGVGVQINGKAAYLDYISPGQINVLAPSDDAAGSVAVTVTNSSGSTSATVNMQAVLPGLSVLNQYVRAVRAPDGAVVNGTGAVEPGYTTVAGVKSGDVVSLYGTGLGPTKPDAPAGGALFTGAYEASNTVAVRIGGIAAEVLWAGLVAPGLYQINVVVPAALSGDQAVIASVAGAASQDGALLKISG
jgi:uncharacterized protein (TIGR03437 family)